MNILLPNDNKVLKEALKEADSKTLQQMVKNNSNSINDILKNLFDQVKTGTSSNSNIENILKNSNAFKDLGSFSKSITTLLNQIDQNSNLSKYKPLLQSFQKDIKDIDAGLLKEQLGKSGVFLEAKIAQQTLGKNNSLSNEILKVLTQIQNSIKEINNPQTKQINELINKISQNSTNTQDIKSLITLLQNLNSSLSNPNIKNLENLTTQLKGIINNASLVESKISNNSIINQLDTQVKEILTQIKNEVSNSSNLQINNKNSIQQLENLIKSESLFSKNGSTIEAKPSLLNLFNSPEIKLAASTNQNISSQLMNLKNILMQPKIENESINQLNQLKEQINNQTKDLLSQVKSEIISNPKQIDSKNILSQIDTLLKSNDLFNKNDKLIEPKNLLNNLLNSNDMKQASNQNTNISNLILNLKNIIDDISTLENKALNLQNIISEKNQLTQNLKENLANLKNELLSLRNIDTKAVTEIISKLENIQNVFSKIEAPTNLLTQNLQNSNISSFPNNFANNLNNLFLLLKESITNLSSNPEALNTKNQILNTIDKIETIIKENINPININQTSQKADVNPISSDVKTLLLQMQDELASKTDLKSQEMFKQVDKMITQIDYHQLMSYTANSNYVYVPFFWDMLEDGTINMKKGDEEKFYCQINLTLKDFGKVDLMLALYDKNKLDLTIKTQRTHAKEIFRDNLQKLKQNLNNVNLIPVNIKLLDLKEDEQKIEEPTQAYTNNVYGNQLGSSLDIRV